MTLPDMLRSLAETAPPRSVPPGLFDQARRRHRRRWAAALAVLMVLAGSGYGAILAADRRAPVAAGGPGLPGEVYDPPVWTAELDGGAMGPAAVAFWGDTVPEKPFSFGFPNSTALVGLSSDTYRIVYTSGDPGVVLSPDGRTALLAELDLNGAGSMTADDWRTDALDLVTGQRRTVATRAEPVSWSADGRHLLVVKPYYWPDAGTAGVPADLVTVVAWPSATEEWSVRVERPRAVEGETYHYLALSPDASRLAVTTSEQLRVYGRDGAIQWQRGIGSDLLAGPAAWRGDGRLAVMRCAPCPGDWRVEFVDAGTGDPVSAATYPAVPGLRPPRTIAWRADTAYVVAGPQLVSLSPGGAAPVRVLSMPPDVLDFTVAADYVDTIRAAGPPAFGFNPLPMVRQALDVLRVAACVGLVVFLIWRVRRRRIERTQIPPAPS